MNDMPFSGERVAAAGPAAGGETRFSPEQLWRAVRKSWWLLGLLAALGGGGAALYTMGQTRVYEARGTVAFNPSAPQPLGRQVEGFTDTSSDYWNRKEYYNTQYWVVQSPEVLQAVVTQLGLTRSVGFVERSPSKERSKEPLVTVPAAAELLMERLEVTPVNDSRLAQVTYRDAEPERTSRVLNAVIETYIAQNEDALMEGTNTAAHWLRSQLSSLKDELEGSELALHDYKRKQNILSVSLDDQSNLLREQLTQFNAGVSRVKVERARVASRRSALASVKEGDPSELPAAELLQSTVLNALRGDYVASVKEVQTLAGEGKGENHPLYQAARARQETSRKALLAEVRNIRLSLDKDYQALGQELGSLEALVEDAKKQGLELNKLEIEFKRLQRSRDTNERLFALVTDRAKESDLTRMFRLNNVRVVERPQVPKAPISPNPPLNLAAGLMAGALLGLLGALGRELLDRTLKNPEEAEAVLGVPFLGLLPALAQSAAAPAAKVKSARRRRDVNSGAPGERAAALAVHSSPSSGIAEAARAIRTNIMFASPDRPYRTLLVTSPSAGEGKTTVACSIATAMAQAGQRVVLVDCDLRRPSQHKVFGVSSQAGLTTALLEPQRLDGLLVATDVPGIALLPSGALPPNPAELLHSEAFDRLLQTLNQKFDRVIVDSPPLVPVTDGVVLSKKVDGVVLVVRAGSTRRDLAQSARRSLRDVSAPVIGTVLNAVSFEKGSYGYGYGRYAGYQQYGGDEAGAA